MWALRSPHIISIGQAYFCTDLVTYSILSVNTAKARNLISILSFFYYETPFLPVIYLVNYDNSQKKTAPLFSGLLWFS